jgi:NADH dehydrogenase
VPVLITGAASDVGRRLAAILLSQGAQVRTYVTTDDGALRAAGCKVAIGELDDIGRIESAMEQVHTVVHLAGGAEPPPGRSIEWLNEEITDVVVRAAVSAEVVRVLTTSEAGADPAAANAYLRLRGRADRLVSESGLQYAILRCAPVLGLESSLARALARARRGIAAVAPGSGSQRLNPIWAGDVATALALADERDGTVSGIYDLGGPDTVSYDELVRLATGRGRIIHRRSVPALPRVLAEVWSYDLDVNSSEFLAQFPFEQTPLDETLKASGLG